MTNIIMNKKYKLLREMPGLPAGAIFEHRDYDKSRPDVGNEPCGALVLLGSSLSGQFHGWVEGAYCLQGQIARDKQWFEPLEKPETAKQYILRQIDKLRAKLEELED